MPGKKWFILGALLGSLAVITGAFGAHGLKDGGIQKLYSDPEVQQKRIEQWQTAVAYHFYHVPPLLALGLLPAMRPRLRFAAGALFLAGLAGFSGGLYALVLLDLKILGGTIVPLGGTCWIAAWICLALSATCPTTKTETK